MNELPENLEKSGKDTEERDKKGRFVEGHEGIGGRPPGLSITAEIKKKLEEIPEGEKETYLETLITTILQKAVKDKDQQMIKQIWNYIDGMPKQSTEIEHKGGISLFQILQEIEKKKEDE